ncbi:MAG: hypothetical protein IKU86_09455 [Thermoguttaceae bacterium]|nr:hypothetical protein [Thermoguttaceae bacterium]
MKKETLRSRSASRAKLFVAALSVGLAWGAASALPETAPTFDGWRFRVDALELFRADVGEPLSYLDGSGRRVDSSKPLALPETPSTTLVESTTLLADSAAAIETQAGATLGEAEPLAEIASFPSESEEPADARFIEAAWAVADDDVEKRRDWSLELRLEEFAEPSFAEVEAPAWRDDVSVVFATYEELEALPVGANAVASNLVSPALRKLATDASLVSGYYAETSSVSDANATQTRPTPDSAAPAPARVGVFAACGTFEANGVAKTRVR